MRQVEILQASGMAHTWSCFVEVGRRPLREGGREVVEFTRASACLLAFQSILIPVTAFLATQTPQAPRVSVYHLYL